MKIFYRAYIRFLRPKQNSLWRSLSKMRISVSHGNGILLQISQTKTRPPFNAVETEQHYQQMQNDVHATAEKNPVFRNMVMRILVDITKEGMDNAIQTHAGRVVTIFNFIANKLSNKSCRCSSCGASSDH